VAGEGLDARAGQVSRAAPGRARVPAISAGGCAHAQAGAGLRSV